MGTTEYTTIWFIEDHIQLCKELAVDFGMFRRNVSRNLSVEHLTLQSSTLCCTKGINNWVSRTQREDLICSRCIFSGLNWCLLLQDGTMMLSIFTSPFCLARGSDRMSISLSAVGPDHKRHKGKLYWKMAVTVLRSTSHQSPHPKAWFICELLRFKLLTQESKCSSVRVVPGGHSIFSLI